MSSTSEMSENDTQAPRIDIIIPFFQREKGILHRALNSIAEQDYPISALRVIIIDDGSPVPAENELSEFPASPALQIRILKQCNVGPNEARSNGLDHVDPNAKYIAYLDSDDAWTSNHLQRAVKALSHGYTAYFSNLVHLGADAPTYERSKHVIPEEHPSVAGDPTLREYQGDMMHQIVTANIIFMPSLVIDAKALGHVRFTKAHRHGGGDYLYWLSLIASGNARFAFSTKPEVDCGSGINMWYSSGWGTNGFAKRILDEARFRYTALSHYIKNDNTRYLLKKRIAELQVLFLQDIVHRIRTHKKIDWQTSMIMLKEHPPSLLSLKLLVNRTYGWLFRSK